MSIHYFNNTAVEFNNQSPAPRAEASLGLLAEIERLRMELDYLSNQRRLDNGDLARAYDEGRDNERAAVVAWLRAEALEWDETGPARLALGLMSDSIERGEHRREEKP